MVLCEWLSAKELAMALRPSLGAGSTAAPLTGVVWWQGWREEERRKVMALHPLSVLCPRGSGQAGAGDAGQGVLAMFSPVLICTHLFVGDSQDQWEDCRIRLGKGAGNK